MRFSIFAHPSWTQLHRPAPQVHIIMNFVARAMGLMARVKDLGLKESALRYYRSGDIHQLYGKQVGTDSFGNLCVSTSACASI